METIKKFESKLEQKEIRFDKEKDTEGDILEKLSEGVVLLDYDNESNASCGYIDTNDGRFRIAVEVDPESGLGRISNVLMETGLDYDPKFNCYGKYTPVSAADVEIVNNVILDAQSNKMDDGSDYLLVKSTGDFYSDPASTKVEEEIHKFATGEDCDLVFIGDMSIRKRISDALAKEGLGMGPPVSMFRGEDNYTHLNAMTSDGHIRIRMKNTNRMKKQP